MTAQTRAELAAVPGVAAQRDAATRDFVFNHTMLRVKDPRASLDFYTRVLGFTLARKVDFEQAKFTLYFLVTVDDAGAIPDGDEERRQWLAQQRGVLELTHNHGTELESGPVYHDGNREPRGFGHICVSVPDIRAACARFEALGVPFQKRLSDGMMKSIAFIKDPDGYWVEIIQPAPLD
ncbi:lactoylglutathione lyase [Pseudoxanthomonas sangjuensis]|uniref:lactoylglutathione lyase n=1 Tax=Pseudoxanthomonas sangjuensis TaxID=1503750 RepID=UPI001390DCA2|nr:lactoylglutathione lyase [Pseudoxanthomonas sangjuensis]KAF1713258.1 lactoylglutathione lyase [Pseudoxanthomonas sangjuensis]